MPVITQLELESSTGAEGHLTSIGHVFRLGDIAENEGLNATLGGAPLPFQMDVKARWPDGSVKHAVLSFETPAQSESGTLTLESVPTPTISPPIDVADVASTEGYSFQVEIEGETLDVAPMLGSGSAWLSGALASEVRVTKTLGDGIDVRVDVRATADGEIATSVIVGNDNVETTGLAAKTYDVRIVQNGVELYNNPALTQPHFTVWRESFTTAEDAAGAHLVYDLDYLRQTGLLPSVDDTLPLSDSAVYHERLTHEDATYDPLELGGIDNVGGVDGDRGRTGITPSYGLITDDQHSYLVTQSAEARAAMLALTDQFGTFSNYYRNPETGEAYFLEDTDSNSYSTGTGKDVAGTGGVIDLVNDGPAQRNSFSHKPSEYYLSYLVTGDRYYADGLAHEAGSSLLLWANATYLSASGLVDFGAQLREQAGVLRDLFYAASLAPDGSRAAEVLTARLDGALQDYVDFYVTREGPLANEWGTMLVGERADPRFIGGDLEGALQSYNGTAIDRPYWQDWFAMVVGQIAATGNENAIALGRWMAGFGAERFLQDDFDPNHNLFSILDYPNTGGSRNLVDEATWERLDNAARSVGGVGPEANSWEEYTFYAGSAWGGAAAAFSGVRDARYAEALLWMSARLTDQYVETVFTQGSVPQFGVPVTFADYTIAGVQDRTNGTALADTISDGDANRVINAGDGDDRIVTGAGSHLVEGGDGDDQITGGAGEDWFFGGSGADILMAGGGINYLQGDRHDVDFGRFADVFSFEGSLGTTTIGDFDTAQDTLRLAGIAGLGAIADVLPLFADTAEGAVLDLGEAGRLLLTGIAAASLDADNIDVVPLFQTVLVGTAGRDRLYGDDGNDMIHGLQGNDVVRGAAGADTLDGGEGLDWVQYVGSSAGVVVNLTADAVTGLQSVRGGDAEGDIISGFERVYGSDHADTLAGNEGSNYLLGRGGADTIDAGGGNDHVRGGAGADTLDGGAGIDWVQYIGSSAGVMVDLSMAADGESQSASGGDAEGDIIRGFERVHASDHDDMLTGDSKANFFIGRAGNDTITAGRGNDGMKGGSGSDIFVFAPGDGVDRILDFESQVDRLAFLGLGFDDLTVSPRGTGVQIGYGDGDIVYLSGVGTLALTADDFLFA